MAVRADRIRKCWIDLDAPASDLTAMPTLLDQNLLPSEMLDKDGSYPAQDGGGDVDFSTDTAGTSRIACEIVDLTTDNTPANATAEIWVPLDYSSAGGNGVEVWYNSIATDSQPAASAPYGSESVWSSDYKLVSHDGGLTDSTQYSNNGTGYGGISGGGATGKIGDGTDFNGSSQYFSISNVISDVASSTTGLLSVWVKPDDATPTGNKDIIMFGHASYNRQLLIRNLTTGKTRATIYDNDDNPYWSLDTNNAVFSDGVFCRISIVQRGNDPYLYINGSAVAQSFSAGAGVGWFNDVTYNVGWIGRFSNSAYTGGYYDGIMDEVRIAIFDPSGDWEAHEYSNQNDPANFGTVGTPQNVSGGATFIPKLFWYM